MTPNTPEILDRTFGQDLVAQARAAIAAQLGTDQPARNLTPTLKPDGPAWAAPGACFVTLTRHGALRGCIGTLEAHRPLLDDLRHNARAAAFADPRFAPLTAEEWPEVQIEVSLLSPPEPLTVADETDAVRQLVPQVDGVIFACGGRRATFLPQVWTQLPEPRQFLARLKEKAGFPAGFWSDAVRLSRYRVRHWSEP